MPYALFEDDQKLSQNYLTEEEVWEHAEEAGLIDVVNTKKVLEDGYTIKPYLPDEETGDSIAVPPSVTRTGFRDSSDVLCDLLNLAVLQSSILVIALDRDLDLRAVVSTENRTRAPVNPWLSGWIPRDDSRSAP